MVTGASKALGNSLDTIRFFLFSWKRETVLLTNIFFFFWTTLIYQQILVSFLQHPSGRVQVIFKKTAEEEGEEDCKSTVF